MGSFDGAETCELVGLFILNELTNTFEKGKVGLYRDDGLAVLKNASGHQADKVRKDTIRIFKDLGLDITIQVNLKIVNFLDVTFNLHDGTFQPYYKPNETPMYINVKSNHPPNIIKQLPSTINKRLNELSSNEEVFKKSAPFYNQALKASGYKETLKYNETSYRSKRTRSRNIIWFNPPYSVNVRSNIAHLFLRLIDTHFKKGHRLHKVFNRNKVKVSYSCMPNVSSYIKSHNAKILTPPETSTAKKCNCRKTTPCPLQGKCMINSVVYRGLVTNPQKSDTNYIGMTQGPFKDREREHRNSFTNTKKKTSSKIASHIWKEKDEGTPPSNVSWSVIDRAPAYRNGDRQCRLCLTEKYHIIFQPFQKINKRSEIISKCRHENKFYLCNYKG